MNKPDNNYSRLNRKRGRNRSDKILNILIAVVVLAIIITASIIFLGGEDNDKADVKSPDTAEEENNNDDLASDNADGTDNNDSTNENDDADQSTDNSDESGTDEETKETDESDVEEDPGVVKYESSNDPVVEETIIQTGWEPIGTTQTGDHVSLYVKNTADWNEKIAAISYATNLPEDALIIWKIKNGGSPQKSIGIVSTKDKVEKYRVYLEWVDEKGWKPVKMDVLNTLDFDY